MRAGSYTVTTTGLSSGAVQSETIDVAAAEGAAPPASLLGMWGAGGGIALAGGAVVVARSLRRKA